MPASISQTGNILRGNSKWLHGDGWFSEREEKILVNRLLRDDPAKGDMNNRQHVNWKGFVKAISDYDLWPIYFVSPSFSHIEYTKSLKDWCCGMDTISAYSKLYVTDIA